MANPKTNPIKSLKTKPIGEVKAIRDQASAAAEKALKDLASINFADADAAVARLAEIRKDLIGAFK